MTLHDYLPRYAVLFVTAGVLTLVLEPLVIRWAKRYAIVDTPNGRRIHKDAVACAGGLVFFPVLLVCMLFALYQWPVLWSDRYFGLALGALIITLTGVWDDIFGMRAPAKLLCQFAAGSVLFAYGYRLARLSIPFVGNVVELGMMDYFLTVLVIATVINAVNMIDGLDGLAAGSVLIMSAFLFINKLAYDGPSSVLILLIVMGATLGFLRYNFHPAKVFMGDTGSMVLGLILASELLDSASQGTAVTTLLMPLVVLGIPIFDMVRTVFTRAKTARHIFKADKSHLHHRLLSLGLSHREVVLFIYLMNIYMGIMAIIYKHVATGYRGLYVLSLGLFLFMAFYLVGMGHRNNGRGHDDQ